MAAKGEKKIGTEKTGGGADLEAGNAAAAAALYPKMAEDPRLRWAFIRKVYGILAIQLLFTAGVAAVFSFVRPIPAFLLSGTASSWVVFVLIEILPFFVLFPMLHFRKRHPVNVILLAFYTLCISASVGLACSTFMGTIVLVSAILTAAVVISLTLYTFWAAGRGRDFSFLAPFLLVSLIALLIYLGIQIIHPLGRVGMTIYGLVATIVFSAMVVWDTDNLIKRHTYDEHVVAAIALYLDVVNIFMSFMTLSSSGCN